MTDESSRSNFEGLSADAAEALDSFLEQTEGIYTLETLKLALIDLGATNKEDFANVARQQSGAAELDYSAELDDEALTWWVSMYGLLYAQRRILESVERLREKLPKGPDT